MNYARITEVLERYLFPNHQKDHPPPITTVLIFIIIAYLLLVRVLSFKCVSPKTIAKQCSSFWLHFKYIC